MDVPQNAPESCPGTSSTEAGKASACAGCPNQAVCASAPKSGADPDAEAISERMRRVKHKILVLSGKGGVGKSTVSSQLAFALAAHGKEVGLLDIDICGPSAPKMFGLEGQEVHQSNLGWSPVYVEDNLAVMSIGFMLPDPNEAVIWRGPRKNSLIKQFLKDVNWGELDYLVVDAPPGTSDEHITIAQCLKSEGTSVTAVIVTTPQQVSIIDVRKEVNFCKKVGLSVLGVVENMSGLQQRMPFVRFEAEQPQPQPQQPASGGSAASGGLDGVGGVQRVDVTARVIEVLKRELGLADASQLVVCTDVFEVAGGGAEQMCADMAVPFLGRIPLDPAMGQAAERGESVLHARGADGAPVAAAQALCTDALRSIVGKIVEHLSAPGGP